MKDSIEWSNDRGIKSCDGIFKVMDGTFVAYARYSSTVLQYGQIKTTK